MATFDDIVRNSDNVRKVLDGQVLLGAYPSGVDITTLVTAGGVPAMPVGYRSVGWLTEDGLTFGSETEVSEVRAWGASSALRRDIISTDRTMSFVAQETNKLTLELRSGVDLSSVEMSATGEVVITHPDRTPSRYWRALAIGADGEGANRYYVAKFFPKAVVSEVQEEAWTGGDDPLTYGITLSALIDDEVGTACREFIFGPGALAAAEAMGWEIAGA